MMISELPKCSFCGDHHAEDFECEAQHPLQLTSPESKSEFELYPKLGVKDYYPTPERVVHVLMKSDMSPLDKWTILDPTAGEGDILKAMPRFGWSKERLHAVELRTECLDGLREHAGKIQMGDWNDIVQADTAVCVNEAIVGNPPFSYAKEIIASCFVSAPKYIAMLLRTEVLGAPPWKSFWREHMCSAIRTVPWRIHFPGTKGTDWYNHSWFIWIAGEQPLDIQIGPEVDKHV